MSSAKREAIKKQIEDAFSDTPKPDDASIGYNPDDWESAELALAFKGRHWQDITPAELQYHSSSFLSSEGFHYYLPAYLLAALDDYGSLLQKTVFGLGPPNESSPRAKDVWAWQLERFERLSSAQKRAVRVFLEYARDECTSDFIQGDAPRLALERYWGQH